MTALDEVLPLAVSSLCRMSPTMFNEAHWPAAVIAAWLYADDPDLDRAAAAPMTAQALAMMREMGQWFTEPVASRGGDPDDASVALRAGAGRLTALGHDIIFGALALTAMRRRPELATSVNVDGLVALIGAIQKRGPGGPFPGWDDPAVVAPLPTIPALRDPVDLARTTLDGFVATGPCHEGFDQGVVVHLLTHAHATLLLDDLGCADIAAAEREAHRTYLTLVTKRPEPEGSMPAIDEHLDPRTRQFWEASRRGTGRWLFGHVFKVPLAFEALTRVAGTEDPAWRTHLAYTVSVT